MRYVWLDENSGKKIEVERRMVDSDKPPTHEEALSAETGALMEEEASKAKWKKVITGGVGHVGFGMKGHW